MTVLPGKISRQAWMTAPETEKLMAALLRDGGEARFVGGCVRDALVNRKVIDIDIATPLLPDAVIARLAGAGIPHAPTGLSHGTVTAIVEGRPFEITTLRRDVRTHGRRADVAFTDDWQADAARRDFTINAMSATPAGDVHDFFGGIADLRLGKVVFVGDPEERIGEDILRILRFFRFYAHFGQGAPDAAALAACAKMAGRIPELSAERIRQEVLKLLDSDRCAPVWQIMLAQGITGQFLPRAENTSRLERLVALEQKFREGGAPLRRLAALLDDADGAAEALRLSNDQARQLAEMMKNPPPPRDAAAVRRLVYKSGNDMARSLILLAAAREEAVENLQELYDAATAFRPPRFPLTGDDVLKLGHAPGPAVGALLGTAEDWWITQDFKPGRTECLGKLKELSRL